MDFAVATYLLTYLLTKRTAVDVCYAHYWVHTEEHAAGVDRMSRSTNIVPFHMLDIVSYCVIVTLSLRYSTSKMS